MIERVKRALGAIERSFRGWQKTKRNKKEMKIFNAGAGKPIRVEPEDPREIERQRIMRDSRQGHAWRNY